LLLIVRSQRSHYGSAAPARALRSRQFRTRDRQISASATGGEDMTSLQEQHVVVIGGTSGIGYAAAKAVASLGAEVTVVGRDPQKAEAAARQLGHKTTGVRADAHDPQQMRSVFERVGQFDHLVLSPSAGPAGAGPIKGLKIEELRAGFEGKFWPDVATLQVALPHLRAAGSCVFIGAASAGAAMAGVAGFAAINGALEAMIPGLAIELKPLRVNAVSPGVVNTPFWSVLPDDEQSAMFGKYAAATPVGRIAGADDIGHAVAFVISNDFVTGVVLRVDGGLSLAACA
jgi:NAD(P)-dependent dehydrogenase (short-subunit alcohol dehydrogenase family)